MPTPGGRDLALQEAVRLLLTLDARPSAKEMGPLAEAWRPWRGAAACMLWSYYRAAKQREGAPLQPSKSAAAGNPTNRPGGAMAAELDGPRIEPRTGARRASLSCSCTAMVLTVTI